MDEKDIWSQPQHSSEVFVDKVHFQHYTCKEVTAQIYFLIQI